jgi:phospholipid/cholesterol/gamma-HCH transport system ATP-binding protein
MSEHYFEFRNVSKSFGDNDVLKDVSFFVDHGETAVILGRSGVGKSVSLKLLLGFLQPDSGQIIVAGQDVTEWTEKQFSEIRCRGAGKGRADRERVAENAGSFRICGPFAV